MSSPQPTKRHDAIAFAADLPSGAFNRDDPAADASSGHARALQDDLARRIAAEPSPATEAAPQDDTDIVEAEQDSAFLSTVTAGPDAWRLAIAVVVVSALTFLVAIPFVRVPLQTMPAFIPAYQSALAINDLITAILLFGQFRRLRSWTLLPLRPATCSAPSSSSATR